MLTYRGHIVYVVTNAYPEIAATSAAQRAAQRCDLDKPLGVITKNGCVPLSPYEVDDLRATGRSAA